MFMDQSSCLHECMLQLALSPLCPIKQMTHVHVSWMESSLCHQPFCFPLNVLIWCELREQLMLHWFPPFCYVTSYCSYDRRAPDWLIQTHGIKRSSGVYAFPLAQIMLAFRTAFNEELHLASRWQHCKCSQSTMAAVSISSPVFCSAAASALSS